MIVGLAAFLAGLGAARSGVMLDDAWLWMGLFLVVLSWRVSRLALLVSVALMGLLLGWWRGAVFLDYVRAYEQFYGQKVVIAGTAETDAVYGKNAQLSFDMTDLEITEPESASLAGKIKVEGFGVTSVNRGDVVQVEGSLRPSMGSRQGQIGFAQLEVLGRSTSAIEDIRHRFLAGMQSALPEPHASFGLGLLIGQRSTLPQNVADQLSTVGLTHLIAVSGYNLMIIVRGSRRFLKKSSKYQSTVISIGLITTFLLFTGFSPSIIRAAIVSILGLTAWYYGRAFRPMLLLLLTAALTAGWYPIYLWSDIGWYLSFLAFYGVLVLAPLLVRRFYGGSKRPRALLALIIETLCAQIMTMPLIMFIFKEISVVSLVANILVVPLVPFAMLGSLVAGIAGMLVPSVAGWLAWPALVLLTYMLDIVSIFAGIPHALAERSLSLWQMLVMYGAVGLISLVLWRKAMTPSAKIREANRYSGILE